MTTRNPYNNVFRQLKCLPKKTKKNIDSHVKNSLVPTVRYKQLEEKINDVVFRDDHESLKYAIKFKMRPGVSTLDKDSGERVF